MWLLFFSMVDLSSITSLMDSHLGMDMESVSLISLIDALEWKIKLGIENNIRNNYVRFLSYVQLTIIGHTI